MATAIESYEFYSKGASGASQIVGNSGDGTANPRVVRYTFTTPAEGASEISFSKYRISAYSDSSSTSEKLRFYISDDPDAYKKADATYTYHGTLELTAGDGWYTAEGSASNLILLPNTTYYLFIFPGHTSFGLWYWNYPADISLTLSGAAGIAWICIAEDCAVILHVIYIQGEWKLVIPYIWDGQMWKLCS